MSRLNSECLFFIDAYIISFLFFFNVNHLGISLLKVLTFYCTV